MPEATPLSPELARSVSQLARSLVAAARTWSLYPPEHPVVRSSVDRLRSAVDDASGGHGFVFGVTPETLLVAGAPAGAREGAVAEAAAWLHQRDILEISFAAGDKPDPNAARKIIDSLAKLVSQDRTSLMALMALKRYDNYTFTHMVNVSVLGAWLTLH